MNFGQFTQPNATCSSAYAARFRMLGAYYQVIIKDKYLLKFLERTWQRTSSTNYASELQCWPPHDDQGEDA
jgi:hypothetical protein